jgi:hypothetical protein
MTTNKKDLKLMLQSHEHLAKGPTCNRPGNAPNHYQDDWWLEHLEEELEPNLREDLELLLKNSKADRKILESLKKTRRVLKSSDEVAMPESGLFYENLHNKIMASLDDEVIEERAPSRAYKSSRNFAWSRLLAPIGMTMMMAAVTFVMSKQPSAIQNLADQSFSRSLRGATGEAEEGFDRRLAMVAAEDLEQSSFSDTVMGVESEADFIAGTAARKLERLSRQQVESIYRMMRER